MKRNPGVTIAYASSAPDAGGRAARPMRWTELTVYYAEGEEKPFTAESIGHSTYPGEVPRVSTLKARTLDRALENFDPNTQLGRNVISQAKDWQDSLRAGDAPAAVSRESAPGFDGGTQEEAIRWLYGEDVDMTDVPRLLERDFGAGRSTSRMALKDGRDIRLPLVGMLRFFDRAAFRASLEASRG